MVNKMKVIRIALAFSMITTGSVYAANISVRDGHVSGNKTVEIYGGKGTSAEKLFNSLTSASESEDNEMGGRYHVTRTGKHVSCDQQNGSFYVCAMEVTPSGEFTSAD